MKKKRSGSAPKTVPMTAPEPSALPDTDNTAPPASVKKRGSRRGQSAGKVSGKPAGKVIEKSTGKSRHKSAGKGASKVATISIGLTLEQKKEKVKNFRPIDDVFFECLASRKPVCQEILRTILEDKNLVVLDVIVQSDERNIYGRSVRLDALCILGDGSRVNIEVQRSNNDDHFRRVRFNASSITVKDSNPGDTFGEIPELYIIYISEKDFMHQNKTTYHVDKVIRETGTVIDDGLHIIYVNAQIKDGTDISELMTCFMEKTVSNPKFPALSENVTELKETEGGVTAMCQIMQHYEEKARQQGMKQGIQQGKDQFAGLMQMLFDAGRIEDAKRAASVPAYRDQLMKELAI